VELAGHFANTRVNTLTWDFLQMAESLQTGATPVTSDNRQQQEPTKRWHKPHPTPEQIQQLVDGYRAGATVLELAEEAGLHRMTVSGILKRAGVTLRLGSMGTEDIALARRLYKSGLSLARVAEQVPFNPNTIRMELVRHGVAMRDSHGRTCLPPQLF
jgi:lambda repressor-like predicted transcriptional regulator